uniref:Uncharacterized protein n=1 Tax=Esox lucius TaxID=8010 RepID=A0AAY5KJP3_ESOLU
KSPNHFRMPDVYGNCNGSFLNLGTEETLGQCSCRGCAEWTDRRSPHGSGRCSSRQAETRQPYCVTSPSVCPVPRDEHGLTHVHIQEEVTWKLWRKEKHLLTPQK